MELDPKSREAGIEAAFGIIGDDVDGLKLERFLQTLPDEAKTIVISLVNSARGTLRKQKELSDIIAGLHGDIRILRDEVNLYKKRDLEAALPVDDDEDAFMRSNVDNVEARRRTVHAYAQAMLPSFLGRVQKFGNDEMNSVACAACALYVSVDTAATSGFGWGDEDDLFVMDDEGDAPDVQFTDPVIDFPIAPKRSTRKTKNMDAESAWHHRASAVSSNVGNAFSDAIVPDGTHKKKTRKAKKKVAKNKKAKR